MRKICRLLAQQKASQKPYSVRKKEKKWIRERLLTNEKKAASGWVAVRNSELAELQFSLVSFPLSRYVAYYVAVPGRMVSCNL